MYIYQIILCILHTGTFLTILNRPFFYFIVQLPRENETEVSDEGLIEK